MSIEKIDQTIEKLIEELAAEHRKTGWTGPSDERKTQITKEIARLRASMNSQQTDKKA